MRGFMMVSQLISIGIGNRWPIDSYSQSQMEFPITSIAIDCYRLSLISRSVHGHRNPDTTDRKRTI